MEERGEKSVAGINVWSKFKGSEIPGSTRVPVEEFNAILGGLKGKKILDVGSGSGRSSS